MLWSAVSLCRPENSAIQKLSIIIMMMSVTHEPAGDLDHGSNSRLSSHRFHVPCLVAKALPAWLASVLWLGAVVRSCLTRSRPTVFTTVLLTIAEDSFKPNVQGNSLWVSVKGQETCDWLCWYFGNFYQSSRECSPHSPPWISVAVGFSSLWRDLVFTIYLNYHGK